MGWFAKEPAVIIGVVQAALVLAVAFGFELSGEQVGAITAFAAAVLALVVRQSVVSPATLAAKIGEIPARAVGGLAGRLVGASAKRDEGGAAGPIVLLLWVGAVLCVVAVFAFLFGACDALFEDEDEVGDLGLPALILDHDGWDGGSDGNTGYDGEGGRSGDTDQRGNENCRNFLWEHDHCS